MKNNKALCFFLALVFCFGMATCSKSGGSSGMVHAQSNSQEDSSGTDVRYTGERVIEEKYRGEYIRTNDDGDIIDGYFFHEDHIGYIAPAIAFKNTENPWEESDGDPSRLMEGADLGSAFTVGRVLYNSAEDQSGYFSEDAYTFYDQGIIEYIKMIK